MGCHTWFYNKVDDPLDYEDIRTEVLEEYKTEFEYLEKIISDTLPDTTKWLYGNIDIEEYKKIYEILKRRYRLIEGRFCKLATITEYCDIVNTGIDFSRVNCQFYSDVNDFHDIFRIGNYPKNELFSYQETLAFIEKHKDEIFFPENWKENLEKFWEKYPNGRITFG